MIPTRAKRDSDEKILKKNWKITCSYRSLKISDISLEIQKAMHIQNSQHVQKRAEKVIISYLWLPLRVYVSRK